MKSTVPHITQALEGYAITQENLWVLFVGEAPERIKQGKPPVSRSLCLAEAGELGREQIEKIEVGCKYYLGVLSYHQLRQAMEKLDDTPVLDAGATGWGRLLRNKVYIVPALKEDCATFYQVSAKRVKDAVELIRQRHPEHRVGLAGEKKDFDQLLKWMERVIDGQNFRAIFTDRRDPIKTWDASRLLYAKKNPPLDKGMMPYPDQEKRAR